MELFAVSGAKISLKPDAGWQWCNGSEEIKIDSQNNTWEIESDSGQTGVIRKSDIENYVINSLRLSGKLYKTSTHSIPGTVVSATLKVNESSLCDFLTCEGEKVALKKTEGKFTITVSPAQAPGSPPTPDPVLTKTGTWSFVNVPQSLAGLDTEEVTTQSKKSRGKTTTSAISDNQVLTVNSPKTSSETSHENRDQHDNKSDQESSEENEDWFTDTIPVIIVPGLMGTRLIDPYNQNQLIFDPGSSEHYYKLIESLPTSILEAHKTIIAPFVPGGFSKGFPDTNRLKEVDKPLNPAINDDIENCQKKSTQIKTAKLMILVNFLLKSGFGGVISFPIAYHLFSTQLINEAFNQYKKKADKIKNFAQFVPAFYDKLAFGLSDDNFLNEIRNNPKIKKLDKDIKEVKVYIFGYDWRQNCSKHADNLDRLVNQAKDETQAKKVIIVAHSMGGLVSRYYCCVGNPKPPRQDKVQSLILIASPTHGTPQTYRLLKQGVKTFGDLGLRVLFWKELKIVGEGIRDFFRQIPSLYNLLPSKYYCQKERWLLLGNQTGHSKDTQEIYEKNELTTLLDCENINTVKECLKSRKEFDDKLGTKMPSNTYIIYSSRHNSTEIRHEIGFKHKDDFSTTKGDGDETVSAFSARAEGCGIKESNKTVITEGNTKHSELPNNPKVIEKVKEIIIEQVLSQKA